MERLDETRVRVDLTINAVSGNPVTRLIITARDLHAVLLDEGCKQLVEQPHDSRRAVYREGSLLFDELDRLFADVARYDP